MSTTLTATDREVLLERREEAHRLIAKKYRRDLEANKRWSKSELAELGPNLRTAVEKRIQRSEVVKQRLEWPREPDFDRRAFEKSGFEDPIGMELL